jgi:hypothetical protein
MTQELSPLSLIVFDKLFQTRRKKQLEGFYWAACRGQVGLRKGSGGLAEGFKWVACRVQVGCQMGSTGPSVGFGQAVCKDALRWLMGL